MEVKINREIRNYTESMFFGLSMRQFIFSVLACGVAVGLYFILRPYFGVETLSWMCILGAAPFWQPCGMVRLLCELVRQRVRLYRSRGYPEVCGLRVPGGSLVPGARAVAGQQL